MRNQNLKFRHPDLNFIPYIILIGMVLFLPIILIDPLLRRGLNLNPLYFTLGAIFMGGFFCLLLLLPALFFLNIFWRQFIFDEISKILIIKRYIFFFPIGKEVKVAFSGLSMKLEHRLLSAQGGDYVYVWFLMLTTPVQDFTLGYSLIKKRLEKKKELIEQMLS